MDGSRRTLVIGLGNPILGDDSVGLHVARTLQTVLAGRGDVEVVEETNGGLRLMERMVGFERAIVVDALTSGMPAGTITELRLNDRPTRRSASAHDVDLPTALAVGRQVGASLPADDDILLIGIEADPVETFGERLTPPVAAAVPRAADRILAALRSQEEAK
jgi:hydrogenase maturation protease